jgi:hypothetical protein
MKTVFIAYADQQLLCDMIGKARKEEQGRKPMTNKAPEA